MLEVDIYMVDGSQVQIQNGKTDKWAEPKLTDPA
jgi:hypothetical protein